VRERCRRSNERDRPRWDKGEGDDGDQIYWVERVREEADDQTVVFRIFCTRGVTADCGRNEFARFVVTSRTPRIVFAKNYILLLWPKRNTFSFSRERLKTLDHEMETK